VELLERRDVVLVDLAQRVDELVAAAGFDNRHPGIGNPAATLGGDR
jgi:uncharacterized protein (DUF3084 family)